MVKKMGGSKVTYSFRKSSKYGMVSAAIGVLAIIERLMLWLVRVRLRIM